MASVEHFNRASHHVLQLLRESALLLEAGSPARGAFLAIYALEENAKVGLSTHVEADSKDLKRGGALRSHPKKQALGAGPLPLELKPRLVEVLGREEAERILALAWSGGLTPIWESAIYFEATPGSLAVPEDRIDRATARSILVFAIDTFDDAIVGVTNESYKFGEEAEALLEKLGIL